MTALLPPARRRADGTARRAALALALAPRSRWRQPRAAWPGRGASLPAAAADRGSAALELVILAPVLLALLGLVIAAGRTSVAQGSVDAAARDAARQASIALTPAAAQAAGQASARAALRQDGLDCATVVAVNTSQSAIAPGQPATVTASVADGPPRESGVARASRQRAAAGPVHEPA